MSKDKKVKPATKTIEENRARRMKICVVALVCLSVLTVSLMVYLLWDKVYRKGPSDMNISATRTMLSQRVSYDGTWVSQEEGLFEVYIPGELDTSKEWQSLAVTSSYDTEYDNSLKRAFGVVYSDEKLDITSVNTDPMMVLEAVSSKITNDIATVSRGGRPSVAYDVETVVLNSGIEAIRITGDMELTFIMQKSKTDTETYEEQLTYPVIAYITLQKGYPVGVWCTYDAFDYWCSEEVPVQLEEMLSSLWNTKFTGEDVEWVETDIVYDEASSTISTNNSDTSDSSLNDDSTPDEDKFDSSEA